MIRFINWLLNKMFPLDKVKIPIWIKAGQIQNITYLHRDGHLFSDVKFPNGKIITK